jgi:hypothetical protein
MVEDGLLLRPGSPIKRATKQASGGDLTGREDGETKAAEPGTYVQGMNVLAAPFLYVARSEAEAFVAFHRFLTTECPGYVRGAMDGVHRGLAVSRSELMTSVVVAFFFRLR